MADTLDSGNFKIIPLAHEHSPLGINLIYPAWQAVVVNAPVHDVVHKVGHNKYRLSIVGHFAGLESGKVIASTYSEHEAEWEITHQKHHNAYTIALANKPHLGWTVQTNLAEGHQVELKPIISTHSNPPQFLPTQLFSITRKE